MDETQKLKGAVMRAVFRIARLLAYGPNSVPGASIDGFKDELRKIMGELEYEAGINKPKTVTERVRHVDMPWG